MDNQTPAPDGNTCARCGTALRAAAHFCARCGARRWTAEGEETPVEVVQKKLVPDRWQELRTVGWLYGLLLLSSLVFGLAQYAESSFDPVLWLTFIDGIVILAFAARYRAEILALLRPATFDRNAWKCLARATLVQFVALGAVFYLLEWTGIPFERITHEMQRHDYQLWQLYLLWSLAPAFFEEIAFRGIIYDRLRTVLGDKEAWLVQAALFSVLHLSPVIFLTHFAMGLIFGWLRMRTGSLIPGMILHALWNAAIITLELYQ